MAQIEILKTNQSKDCGCSNKIELKPSCSTSEHFAVNNYLSELVHEWEKEAARYNLGIQELQSIEYVTENGLYGEQLTKVIFKYRKGHEIVTREFYCAPKGDQGDPGNTGLNAYELAQALGYTGTLSEWLASLKGNAIQITDIEVTYDAAGKGYGECEALGDDRYKLHLHLLKPEYDFASMQEIIEQVINGFKSDFYTKSEVDRLLTQQAETLSAKYDALITILNNLNINYE